MELFGLLFAFPVTLIISLVYCFVTIKVFIRWPQLERIAVLASCAVATLILVEICLLVFLGAKMSFERFHHFYTAIHFTNFFLGSPALANLIINLTSKMRFPRWLQYSLGTLCCWFACMAVLLGNIVIDEAIMGVDAGEPFYMSSL